MALHSQGGAGCGMHTPMDGTGIYLPGSGQTCYALSQEVTDGLNTALAWLDFGSAKAWAKDLTQF